MILVYSIIRLDDMMINILSEHFNNNMNSVFDSFVLFISLLM
jgi:hypothetical protein